MANYAEKPQMGFIEACSTACKKIVTFKGRARRSEFWWAVLGIIIFNLIMTPVNYMGKTGVIISNLLSLVITILSAVCMIQVVVAGLLAYPSSSA